MLDPAANRDAEMVRPRRASTSMFLAPRITSTWPQHRVIDGLDQLEILIGGPNREPELIIHPRCTKLIEALKTYKHDEKRGEVMDSPAAVQHPAEDLCDALRGLVRYFMPEGHRPRPQLRTIHGSRLH